MKTGFTMKALSLVVLGLAGLGFGANAFAVCPTDPVTPTGAWTSKTNLPDAASSPLAIVAGGLDASACKLTAAIAQSVTAAATVRYDHSGPEANYRFQFLIDNTNLTAFSATDNVVLFTAPASTVAHGFNRLLRVTLVAGPAGAKRVRFIAQCGTGTFTCAQTYAVDLAPGVNRIEGKLAVGAGAAGSLTYWVNAAAGTTQPAASGTIPSLDNAGWTGVTAAILGLTAPSQAFVNVHHGQAVGFDTFDSRRTSYIGY